MSAVRSAVRADAVDRVTRSLPVTTRNATGQEHRLRRPAPAPRPRRQRSRSTQVDRSKPIVAVAGLAGRDAEAVDGADVARAADDRCRARSCSCWRRWPSRADRVGGGGRAGDAVSVAELGAGEVADHPRRARCQAADAEGHVRPGADDLPISLSAYERAFDAKLRLEAARCTALRHAVVPAPATAASGADRRSRPRRRAPRDGRDLHAGHRARAGARSGQPVHRDPRRARRHRRAAAGQAHRRRAGLGGDRRSWHARVPARRRAFGRARLRLRLPTRRCDRPKEVAA